MVAISQEDKGLDTAPAILADLDPRPTYPILIDLEREGTPRYERTTVYLINAKGIIQQVLPMMTHMRATPDTLLAEIDRQSAR